MASRAFYGVCREEAMAHWKKRFLDKVDLPSDPDDCWNWTASKSRLGYGLFHLEEDGYHEKSAHRAGYLFGGGVLIPGLVLDHICRNTSCVNPRHLRQVTHGENLRAAPRLGRFKGVGNRPETLKKHCRRGHPYSGSNLLTLPGGERRCRACASMHDRARKERNRLRKSRPNQLFPETILSR